MKWTLAGQHGSVAKTIGAGVFAAAVAVAPLALFSSTSDAVNASVCVSKTNTSTCSQDPGWTGIPNHPYDPYAYPYHPYGSGPRNLHNGLSGEQEAPWPGGGSWEGGSGLF